MIRLDQVSYFYGQAARPAVHNLSLSLDVGQMVAVVGANGSGKSTLARLMNGSLLPVEGKVTVNGLDTRNIEQQGVIRRQVGLMGPVPDHQFVSNLVFDDVAFGPQNLGLSRQEIYTRVDAALKSVSMEDYAQYPPYLLSGGQKQRICLAGILAMQPNYLILDEPTSMLDSDGRREVLMVLGQLRRENKMGILLITHHLEEAQSADKVIIMNQGQISAELTYRELVNQPELLAKMGLETPELSRLINELKQEGLLSPAQELDSLDEVVEYLCRSNCKL